MVIYNLLTPGLSILLNGSMASPFPSILGVREIFVPTLALPSICWVTLSPSYLFSLLQLLHLSNEECAMCSHRYIVMLRSKVIMKTLNEQ